MIRSIETPSSVLPSCTLQTRQKQGRSQGRLCPRSGLGTGKSRTSRYSTVSDIRRYEYSRINSVSLEKRAFKRCSHIPLPGSLFVYTKHVTDTATSSDVTTLLRTARTGARGTPRLRHVLRPHADA